MTDTLNHFTAQRRRLIVVVIVVALAVAWMWFARQHGSDATFLAIVAGVGGITVALYWALRSLATVSMFVVACLISGGILLPNAFIEASRNDVRTMQCRSNLQTISVAIHHYHIAHGSYPPAYTTDKNGRRLHSWRVLILPYLAQKHLYDQFRLDEPWNSTHNLRVARQTPYVYQCPSARKGDSIWPVFTQYVAVVGRNTMWPGAKPIDPADIRRGDTHTILLVEWPDSNIQWSEPRDLPVAKLFLLAESGPARQHTGEHYHSIPHVVFADGNVREFDFAKYKEQYSETRFSHDGKELNGDTWDEEF